MRSPAPAPVRLAAAVAALVASAIASGASAQTAGAPPTRGPVPTRLERAEYQVKLGRLSVGSGAMEMVGTDTVNGHPTYHAVLRLEGSAGPAKVNDRFESWIDVRSWTDFRNVFSRRFRQSQRELTFRRNRTYELFPEERRYRRVDNNETGTLPTNLPLDDVSMIFFARSLPLKVGDTYTINRYFRESGNPVVLKVLRRQTVTVPAGTFQTVVVQPTIRTSGLFGEGGRAELFFSDDEYHTLVMLRSQVRLIGSLSLHLRSYTPPW